MPGLQLITCFLYIRLKELPTCFVRSNSCMCALTVCDERDDAAIRELTRRYRIDEGLKI